MNWKAGLMVLVILMLILEGQPRLTLYSVEEALTVLLVIAAVLLLILFPSIAFLLLWQGATFVFLRLKGMVSRVTSIRDHPFALDRR